MYRIQDLMHDQKMEEISVVTTLFPFVINTKLKSTTKYAVPVCGIFQLARVNKIIPSVVKQKLTEVKEVYLSQDKYQFGDLEYLRIRLWLDCMAEYGKDMIVKVRINNTWR